MSNQYWEDAKAVGHLISWLPEVVYTQWVVETNHFKSQVFKTDNNPAGITWYQNCGKAKGLARPEGGNYIHFDNLVDGYAWFIKNNHRYDNVKNATNPIDAFGLLKRDGWATDPNYVQTLTSVYVELKNAGTFDEPAQSKGANDVQVPNLLQGDQGHKSAVMAVQGAVKPYFYDGAFPIDGVFGNKTDQAVRTFQGKNQLKIDGIVGVETWGAILK